MGKIAIDQYNDLCCNQCHSQIVILLYSFYLIHIQQSLIQWGRYQSEYVNIHLVLFLFFSLLRIHINIPATADGTTAWLHCNNLGFCQATTVTANNMGMVYFLAELKGIWTCDTSTLSNATGNRNTLTYRMGFIDGVRKESVSLTDKIRTIKLCKGFSGALPTGTEIKIWGLDG